MTLYLLPLLYHTNCAIFMDVVTMEHCCSCKKKCPRKKPLRNLFLWTFLAVLIHNSLVSPLAFPPVSHCGDRIMIYGNSTQLHWNKFKKEPVLEFSTKYVSQQIAKNLQKNSKIIQDYKLRKYWKLLLKSCMRGLWKVLIHTLILLVFDRESSNDP